MINHLRAHIRLNTMTEAEAFVSKLNSTGTIFKYMIEDFSGSERINARSYLGVIYAMATYNDNMYFINDTEDGNFPPCIDEYRV